MNWISLIVSGLFEGAYATCLGRAKETPDSESNYWFFGFLTSLLISMFSFVKASQSLPNGAADSALTGGWSNGFCINWNISFKEPANLWKLFFLFILTASLVEIKVVSK